MDREEALKQARKWVLAVLDAAAQEDDAHKLTWGDVDTLHGGAAVVDEAGTPGIADGLRSLAGRIESLLPPRET